MLGVLVNAGAIALGVLVGLLFKKLLNPHTSVVVMQAIGISVVAIGIADALKTYNFLLLIISLAAGGFIGSVIGIERGIDKLGGFLERKLAKNEEDKIGVAFVTSTLIFCVGAMLVYGSIEAGLGDNSTLYTKSILDGITSILLTASLGWGVVLSIIPLVLIQGTIVLFAGFIQPLTTPEFMAQLSGIGGVLVMCIGLNLLEIKKMHTADMLPAVLGAFGVFLIV